MFPNPVTSSFVVTMKEVPTWVIATIIDAKGAALYNQKYDGIVKGQISIEVSSLKPGHYWLRLQIDLGIETLKFIKM